MIIMDTKRTGNSAAAYLFGKTRLGLLELLFNHPNTSFYTNEIVRQVGTGTSAVQRELQCLTRAGIIAREEKGIFVLYRANKESPIYESLRSLVVTTGKAASEPVEKRE